MGSSARGVHSYRPVGLGDVVVAGQTAEEISFVSRWLQRLQDVGLVTLVLLSVPVVILIIGIPLIVLSWLMTLVFAGL